MDFVDEQNDVTTGTNFLENLLQALFEVTAVTRTGHEGSEVQGVELLVSQGCGNLVGHNLLSQSFDDGRLTNTGLTDEDGVVLGTARENLHHSLDFLVTANHRIELAIASELRQVATELVENGRTGRFAGFVLGGG
ncbi:unannotated protein [freshwater metagenome]|uniref:Unannotated protein n=1 Tax=freshwater metagenome TaxID=449393 RepID=A0A6J6W482_9ZZZZ